MDETWEVEVVGTCGSPDNPVNVCEITNGHSRIAEHMVESDAHLIAAAPCLLRELSHLVSLMEPLERDGQLSIPGLATLNGARAAIAKAKVSA